MHASTRLLLAVSTIGALSLPALANSVDLVQPNFICDRTQEICYGPQGPSVEKTGRTYGERAERRLLKQLSGRPALPTFTLSSGALCDVRERTCWDDGDRRRNVSQRLTRHLYSGGGGGNLGSRTCQLLQRGRRLFDGGCSMSRRSQPNGTAYVVETQDGRRYTFFNDGYGRLVLRDATGVWPVTTSTSGNQVVFRWADLQLVTFRPYGGSSWGSDQGYRGEGQGAPEPRGSTPSSPAQALDVLLNSLFR